MYTWGLLLSKKLGIDILFCYFINPCEIKIWQKLWVYLTLKSSWSTISAGINVEPQNNAK